MNEVGDEAVAEQGYGLAQILNNPVKSLGDSTREGEKRQLSSSLEERR